MFKFDNVFPDERSFHLAPSAQDSLCELDELSPDFDAVERPMTEGECVNIKISKNIRFAGSFHHFVVPLPPGGRLW